MILIAGGGVLVWKATKEIHHNVDPEPTPAMFSGQASMTFAAAIGQILLLDAVFSIDSIITAVGLTDHIPIMVLAILVTVAVMLLAAALLANFINAPERCDAGVGLSSDDRNDPYCRGLWYESSDAAMLFSAFIEALNLLSRARRRRLQDQPRMPVSGDDRLCRFRSLRSPMSARGTKRTLRPRHLVSNRP
jgi:hypothetical protein